MFNDYDFIKVRHQIITKTEKRITETRIQSNNTFDEATRAL